MSDVDPSEPAVPGAQPAVIHRFTVMRGMVPILIIESRDWYAGLVQAAQARVMVDAAN
jgi:hypothetical protein